MKYNVEKLVGAVLKSVVGVDLANYGKGYAELTSPMAQGALEGLVYALIEENDDHLQASIKSLIFALNVSIDVRKDDPAFQVQPSDPAGRE